MDRKLLTGACAGRVAARRHTHTRIRMRASPTARRLQRTWPRFWVSVWISMPPDLQLLMLAVSWSHRQLAGAAARRAPSTPRESS